MSEVDRLARLEKRLARERAARKEAERLLEDKTRALYTLNEELEARVNERTDQLLKAKQLAEAATDAKQRFLANMSHELRTPLNGILGSCELLVLRGDLPEPVDAKVGLIRRSANALLVIVNDVLDLSKLEAGQLELFPRSTDLAREFRDCEELATSGYAKPEVGFELELDLPPQRHKLDPERLRQVVLNLLSNALKFTEQGQVKLSASWRDGSLRVAVSDTGAGIPVDVQEAVFEEFVQVDSTYARRSSGTGLGLAITRRLVTLMGGEMRLDSEVGRGSTFSFSVPAPLASSSRAAKPARGLRPGLRVLLVDDNSINLTVASEMLMGLGCEVMAIDDPFVALDVFKPSSFDVVLMDCQMPGMDGFEATIRLRAKYGGSTPIIALTGNAFETDRLRALDAGMNAHAVKPISLIGLEEVLATWDPRRA